MYTAVRTRYWDFGLGWPFSGLDRCSRPWACFVELIHCSRPWAFVSEIERRFPFSAAQVSGPRGVQFRRLSGICLAFVRRVSGMENQWFFTVFTGFVRHLSGICPAIVRHLSGICPAFVRQLSGFCPAFVRHLSGNCPAFVRHLSGICPA